MGQGPEPAAQSLRFFRVRRAGLSRLQILRKKRAKRAAFSGGSQRESPRFRRGGESRARTRSGAGGGGWLCIRAGLQGQARVWDFRNRAVFRSGIEGPLSSLGIESMPRPERGGVGASGVRGPGLHLRLESEELVAFLGFSQGFTALVGVG